MRGREIVVFILFLKIFSDLLLLFASILDIYRPNQDAKSARKERRGSSMN